MLQYSGSIAVVQYEHFRGTHNLFVELAIVRTDGMPIVWGKALPHALSPSAVRLAHLVDHIAQSQHIDTDLTGPDQDVAFVVEADHIAYLPLQKKEGKINKRIN